MKLATFKRSIGLMAVSALMSGLFLTRPAHAADPRLDDAKAAIAKAIALLKAAENPDPKHEFGGHRRRAIDLLTRADAEIDKAKQYADQQPKPPKKHEHDHKPKPQKQPKQDSAPKS